MATLNASLAKWIGNELEISRGDYSLPPDVTLPGELWLRSAWVRRRGVLLGRRWYLQCPDCRNQATVDMVGTDEIDGSDDTCIEFLAAHGYVAKSEAYPELMEYVRVQ